MSIRLLSVLILTFIFVTSAQLQEDLRFDFSYEINRIYPAISVSETRLNQVETIVDLNRYFKDAWVREYHSVEISGFINGTLHKVFGKGFELTKDQKNFLHELDNVTPVEVKITYTPENTLKNNPPKEYNFSITIDPDQQASFPGGVLALDKYLTEHIIDKISLEHFTINQLTAVTFTITKNGEIDNVEVFESSNDPDIDKVLVETLCKMPLWQPATYTNGLTVDQKFALTLGDMRSCIVNLLNIRPRKVEEN